ncbi:MAG: helicase-related protein, partial [Candidatus Omnitrophota bacterium]|nr:helicase-related protein [Candidatus Omnitrophota bacterium]
ADTHGIYEVDHFFAGKEDERAANKKLIKACQDILDDPRIKKLRERIHNLIAEGAQHPKIAALNELMKQNINRKIIIFAENRASVENIVAQLNGEGVNSIKAEHLIGKAGKDRMTEKEQGDVLKRFRNNEFNILVATQIGEEGLDMPDVDLVIFYEPVSDERRLVQRAGRQGRSKNGKIYMLITEETWEAGTYYSALRKRKQMERIIADYQAFAENQLVTSFESQRRSSSGTVINGRQNISDIAVQNVLSEALIKGLAKELGEHKKERLLIDIIDATSQFDGEDLLDFITASRIRVHIVKSENDSAGIGYDKDYRGDVYAAAIVNPLQDTKGAEISIFVGGGLLERFAETSDAILREQIAGMIYGAYIMKSRNAGERDEKLKRNIDDEIKKAAAAWKLSLGNSEKNALGITGKKSDLNDSMSRTEAYSRLVTNVIYPDLDISISGTPYTKALRKVWSDALLSRKGIAMWDSLTEDAFNFLKDVELLYSDNKLLDVERALRGKLAYTGVSEYDRSVFKIELARVIATRMRSLESPDETEIKKLVSMAEEAIALIEPVLEDTDLNDERRTTAYSILSWVYLMGGSYLREQKDPLWREDIAKSEKYTRALIQSIVADPQRKKLLSHYHKTLVGIYALLGKPNDAAYHIAMMLHHGTAITELRSTIEDLYGALGLNLTEDAPKLIDALNLLKEDNVFLRIQTKSRIDVFIGALEGIESNRDGTIPSSSSTGAFLLAGAGPVKNVISLFGYTQVISIGLLIISTIIFIKLIRKLQFKADKDKSTGLHNREYFNKGLDKELKHARKGERRRGHPIALLMIDGDDFGRINRKYGWNVGSEVIRKV